MPKQLSIYQYVVGNAMIMVAGPTTNNQGMDKKEDREREKKKIKLNEAKAQRFNFIINC